MTSTSNGYRKSVYDDFVYDQPETPNDNTTTFGGALSPIVDAVRCAKREGSRDWQRLFGSFSKWASSSTPKREEGNKITKRRPEKLDTITRRRRQSLADAANSSTSLTPVFKRHSLYGESSFEGEQQQQQQQQHLILSSVQHSPLRYCESIFGSTIQSTGSRASTPSLDGSTAPSDINSTSSYMLNNNDNNQENIDDDDDGEQIPVAYNSPIRSDFFKLRPVSQLEPPISLINTTTSRSELFRNKGSKSTELKRLERLQERLDEIRNMTKSLAQPAEFSRPTKNILVPSSARMMESRTSIPLRSVRRKTSPTRQTSSQLPSPARSQSTSSLSPLGSVLASKTKLLTNVSSYTVASPAKSPSSLIPPPPPPPPPPPTQLKPFKENKKRRESVLSSNKTPIISVLSRSSSTSTKANKYGPHSPSSAMKNVLGDIPKAKLRSTETYQTPNGSKTKNKFWEEIHAAKIQKSRQPQDESKNTPLEITPLKTSSSVSTRKGKGPAINLPSQWEEGDFWTQSSITSNAFTDKLKLIAQEEEEEEEEEERGRRWKHQLSFTQTPGSLGDELEAATRKEQKDVREKERAQLELSSFLLEPAASECGGSLTSREVCRVIDGDEWTFSGKQYTVNEKRRKI